MYDALYARQSVERTDSISIESQLEACQYEARGRPYKAYIDRGYSGKDTRRPAFAELLQDVREEKVARVIVYKLDRISRSILDFTNMMELFQSHQVEFISSTERFDTATPIGRAMLNLCIVFAQLERETIQKRVTDAYASRCKRGFYMGGRLPYGFTKTDTVIDGIRTACYTPIPAEAEQVQLLYALYADPENSLGDIVRFFKERSIVQQRGGTWTTARLSEMLRNPVYVRADPTIYDFFKSQGAILCNPREDFTGIHACYLYRGTTSRSQRDLSGKEIVLAPHEGIVSAADWLKCRIRCLGNRQSTRTCKAKNSWLSGKIKCGNCGYGLTIVKANTKWERYFVCSASLASKKQTCPGTGGTIYAGVLEGYLRNAIQERAAVLCDRSEPQKARRTLQNKLAELEQQIEDLLDSVPGANQVLLAYINRKIEALEGQKNRLEQELAACSEPPDRTSWQVLSDRLTQWDDLSFADKQAVADVFLESITVANGTIEIAWNL